jgi:hypothetical protein
MWAGGSKASVADTQEIRISFMPWMAMTNRDQSAEDIRSHPNYRFSVLMPWDIKKVLERLELLQMEATTVAPADIRLVIDIQFKDGKRVTYLANRTYLYSENSTRRCKMTPEFKRLFDFQEMELLK